jgi:hypothetical protein
MYCGENCAYFVEVRVLNLVVHLPCRHREISTAEGRCDILLRWAVLILKSWIFIVIKDAMQTGGRT